MLKALKEYLFACIWACIVLVLCNVKLGAGGAPGFFFEGFDKLVHLGFFFVFTVFLIYGKLKSNIQPQLSAGTILKIILLNALLGGGIELLQRYVFTFRAGEWWDFTCDMLGCFMALFSFLIFYAPLIKLKEHRCKATN